MDFGAAPAARSRAPLGLTVAAFVRRHPVAVFLAWFFTVGQAIAFVPLIARQLFGRELADAPFLMTATVIGLLLPTIAITRITDGAEGLRALRRRTLAVGVPARWYGFAVVSVPLVVVAVWAAASGPPEQTSSPALASALGTGLLLQLVVVFVTFNLWEEVAWMGFVQARLQERHGPIRAAVIAGPVFALGHISQVIEDSVSATLVLLSLLIAVSIPFRALQAWVYNRTDSLFLVGLVHAAANATAAGSVLGRIARPPVSRRQRGRAGLPDPGRTGSGRHCPHPRPARTPQMNADRIRRIAADVAAAGKLPGMSVAVAGPVSERD